jgi:uncharacterized phage protein (TIGR02220 family)
MRKERARRAGLASAEARKDEPTTSQLQVNSESTNSQLNSTQGQLESTRPQLNSTNVTKGNVTEGKIIKEKKDKKKEKNNDIPYEEIISYLNERTGREGRFKFNHKSQRNMFHIEKRWSEILKHEHYKSDPIKAFYYVIDVTAAKWMNTDMQDYLQPSTLFRKSNFEKYLMWSNEEEESIERGNRLNEARRNAGLPEIF